MSEYLVPCGLTVCLRCQSKVDELREETEDRERKTFFYSKMEGRIMEIHLMAYSNHIFGLELVANLAKTSPFGLRTFVALCGRLQQVGLYTFLTHEEAKAKFDEILDGVDKNGNVRLSILSREPGCRPGFKEQWD